MLGREVGLKTGSESDFSALALASSESQSTINSYGVLYGREELSRFPPSLRLSRSGRGVLLCPTNEPEAACQRISHTVVYANDIPSDVGPGSFRCCEFINS